MVGSCAVPAPESKPGHTVVRHLFTNLKDVDCTSAKKKNEETIRSGLEKIERILQNYGDLLSG